MVAPLVRPSRVLSLLLALATGSALADEGTQPDRPPQAGWQACSTLSDSNARLACYDQWAASQGVSAAVVETAKDKAEDAAVATAKPTVVVVPADDGCRNPLRSELSRFWELEDGSDCGTFRMRGYRPLTLAVSGGDQMNRRPSSPAPGHSSTSLTEYRNAEMRIQLAVRTKLAQGVLMHDDTNRRDSLWFAYTQQSYWQIFNGDLSRPFRNTDHEPEVIYIYPTDVALPWGWRWRLAGVGLVHHSNGQSLPLSRSWNRWYALAAAEHGDAWQLQAKVWQRVRESSSNDDNPEIASYIGRAEVRGLWNVNADHTLIGTVRHSLSHDARGSVRLEWLRTLGDAGFGRKSNLRLHTQLFHGYGDSLLDYNRRRTVFSLGFSLLDF